MLDKIFLDKKTAGYYKKYNPKTPNSKPIIGFCPDWRKKEDTNGKIKYYYMEFILNMYRSCIEKAGGILYIVTFQDTAEYLKNKINGYLIPGGRDIDPINYNEKRDNRIHDEASERFNHLKDMILNLPQNIPILGICYGLEFINVIFGGTLEKKIKDSHQHFKKRKFSITKGTILNKITGNSIIGSCFHHQGIKSLGKGLKVNCLDDYSQIIHGVEYMENNRWILAVLWHPEYSFDNEKCNNLLEENQKIFNSFIKEVKIRKINNY